MEKRWYIVHTYVGSEERVERNLEQRIRSMNAEDKIFRVEVPKEPEIEMRGGQRVKVEKKILPGYILVEMLLDNESWSIVRNTPGVTGFISSEDKDSKLLPVPLEEEQVKAILQRGETAQPRVRTTLSRGESVRITSGPFAEFIGIVEEVHPEKGKARVLVSFFGRETPIELDILEVERS